jgi:hypothetical protein
MFLPKQYAHLTGALSAFAARLAAADDLLPEQLRLEIKQPARPPKARPRWQRPAPRQSRQYGVATPTTVDRDPRITSGAVRLAHLLVALAGRGDVLETERWRLAKRLGVSVRTISRYLSDLRGDEATGHTSYIQTEHMVDERGMTAGLRITITLALRPYWIQEAQGVTDVSPKKTLYNRIGESSGSYPQTSRLVSGFYDHPHRDHRPQSGIQRPEELSG